MTLELKIQILNDWSESKSHITKADLARKYKRNESTIRNIINSENAIRKAFSELSSKRKNCTQSKCLEIDEALRLWFYQQREKGVPISGPILKSQALLFHNKIKESKLACWNKAFNKAKFELFKTKLSSEQFQFISQETKQIEIDIEWSTLICSDIFILNSAFSIKLKSIENPFIASNGFLRNFKDRYGIRELAIQGEQLSCDENAIGEFKMKLKNLITEEGYQNDQIYNADESGLYWKALPTKTLASSKEKITHGFKINKDRITINFCANVSGNDKLPLLIIGKSKKPRSIKDCIRGLPVWYKSSSSAWMTGEIFYEWIHHCFIPHVSNYLKTLKLPLKALLLIDNATVHQCDFNTSSIQLRVLFLPPNTTALIQPMDQGVISSFKRNYRSKFMHRMIARSGADADNLIDSIKMFTLKDCIFMSSDTWNNIAQSTLQNSWKKLEIDIFKDQVNRDVWEKAEINSLVSSTAVEYLDILGLEENDIDEFNSIDKDDKGHGYLEDNEIIDHVLKDYTVTNYKNIEEEEGKIKEDSDPEDEREISKVSYSEAIEGLNLFINYATEKETFSAETIGFLNNLILFKEII